MIVVAYYKPKQTQGSAPIIKEKQMSKNKINKEIRQSERKKYLRTMMADLGVESLSDLPSDQARKDLLNATKPNPSVKKRLKEMGYDFSGGKNKRSLGSLNVKIAANSSIDSLIEIRGVVGTAKYRELLRELYPKKWSRDYTFDEYRKNIVQKLDQKVYLNNKIKLDELLKNIYDFFYKSSKEKSSDTIIKEYLIKDNKTISVGHEYPGDTRIIQTKLEALGFLKPGYQAGVFSKETRDAVKSFQRAAGIPITGEVDHRTFIFFEISDIKPGAASASNKAERRDAERTTTKQVAPESQVSTEIPRDLSFIHFRNREGISGANDDVKRFLYILNDVAKKKNKRVTITSLYRSPKNQARVMLNNYNSRARRGGDAGGYVKRLYRKYPPRSVNRIVDIFAERTLTKKQKENLNEKQKRDLKIKQASRVISQSWPKVGHLGGESVDIVPHNTQIKEILEETQNFAEVNILDESNHFHITVKSLKPGGWSKSFKA